MSERDSSRQHFIHKSQPTDPGCKGCSDHPMSHGSPYQGNLQMSRSSFKKAASASMFIVFIVILLS